MGPLRRKGFLAAVATCAILALYFSLVAGRALIFIETGDPVAIGLGAALLVLPVVGVWWLVKEWRLGSVVQRMADTLQAQDRLPIIEPGARPSGRLDEDEAMRLFTETRGEVDARPEDWAAWFNLAFAYEAGGDRRMARQSLRHAADLYRAASR
jgi:cytochrome c-type biogenesis protein CcmH/NrfG